jgi:hypothetical protein
MQHVNIKIEEVLISEQCSLSVPFVTIMSETVTDQSAQN